MRRWLAAAAVVLAATSGSARADGELTARGMYFKEQATRVVQPMLDALFDVGDTGTADAHFLVDAITSASAATGAQGVSFTERRYEAGAGYTHQLHDLRLGGTARYSTEPDYRSAYGSLRGELELFQKNLTLSATFGAGHDDFDNSGAGPMAPRVEGTLTTLLGSLAASQIVSEHGVVGLSYDLIRLDGDQENLYRVVNVGGSLLSERHPKVRTRHALGASLKWFFPGPSATLIGQYRFYADDWDLHANTVELRAVKDVGEWITVGARYRYHRQDAADFYQDAYAPADVTDPYLSADVKLSAFDSHLVGARLEIAGGAIGTVGVLENARLELLAEYVVQHNDFGNALVSYVALVLPFEY